MCDEVVVLDAGSDDGSQDLVMEFENEKTKIVRLPASEWNKMRGKEKLSHYTNVAKGMLTTEWHFNLQADESVASWCFPFIRQAIERDEEAFFCTRINMWGNSKHQLNVDHSRTPVGTKIVRLAKTKYYSVGDGEGIFAPASWDFLDKIIIHHAGFVRNKFIHTKKIENMLMNVFCHNEMDPKITEMKGVFDPFSSFSKDDLIPLSHPLPEFIKEWCEKRDEINQIIF